MQQPCSQEGNAEVDEKSNSLLEEGARRAGGVTYQDTPGFCKSTTLEEVKAQDYKLTPGIYVGTEEEEDDGIPFEEKMEKLKRKLNEQFSRSNELQKRIGQNLINF